MLCRQAKCSITQYSTFINERVGYFLLSHSKASHVYLRSLHFPSGLHFHVSSPHFQTVGNKYIKGYKVTLF